MGILSTRFPLLLPRARDTPLSFPNCFLPCLVALTLCKGLFTSGDDGETVGPFIPLETVIILMKPLWIIDCKSHYVLAGFFCDLLGAKLKDKSKLTSLSESRVLLLK